MQTPRSLSITVSGHPRIERRPWLGWLCAAALLCPHTGHAQGMRFDVPPQSLGTALDSLAKEAGLQILYPPEAVEGLTTRGVQGEYTPQEAIKRLLDGTGLHYEFLKDNTVTVSDAGKAKPEEEITLPEMIVTASPRDATSYNVQNATTATKTDTPIFDTPVSIQVVPQQVLRDQQVIRLEEATKNVSGVQRGWGYGNLYESFIIRGFDTDQIFYRRLVVQPSETAHLDRVEVLKGPAAVLWGRLEPGGLVNIVTKRPLAEPYYSLEQQFGSYDLYRTTADATGPITKDGSLSYRVNFAYLNTESFRDFIFDDHKFVAPSVTWRPTEDTEFNLALEYKIQDYSQDEGIPAIDRRPAPAPISRSTQEPNVHDSLESYLVDFNWSHRFKENWKLRNGVVYYRADYRQQNIFPSALQADNRTLERFAFDSEFHRPSYGVYLDLSGGFRVLGMDHTVLVGTDYYNSEEEVVGPIAPISSLDIFEPVYGTVDFGTLRETPGSSDFDFVFNEEWHGVYFQDQITFWDKIHILGGGRYDWATTGSGFSGVSLAEARANVREISEEHFSPRVGLVYQPIPWLSLYGNYVESFGANNGRSQTGQPFEPQTGKQYEVGAKTEFFDGRLSSSLAFYHLTKENLLTSDLSTPDNPFDSVAIGEARSRGIELDIAGQVARRA